MKFYTVITALALMLIIGNAYKTQCTRFGPELRDYCSRNPSADICQEHPVMKQSKIIVTIPEGPPSYGYNDTNMTSLK